jgi:hypothetical protein
MRNPAGGQGRCGTDTCLQRDNCHETQPLDRTAQHVPGTSRFARRAVSLATDRRANSDRATVVPGSLLADETRLAYQPFRRRRDANKSCQGGSNGGPRGAAIDEVHQGAMRPADHVPGVGSRGGVVGAKLSARSKPTPATTATIRGRADCADCGRSGFADYWCRMAPHFVPEQMLRRMLSSCPLVRRTAGPEQPRAGAR